MKRCVIYFTLLLLSLCSGACAQDPQELLRLKDGKKVSLEDIRGDLTGVPFVFVGEHHDNMSHHDAQLAIIQALAEAGKPIAIGLEMFRQENQKELERWVQGKTEEQAFKKIFDANWTNAWPLYRKIFMFARQEKIPMVGLNVAPEITRQVARGGFASLTEAQMGQLPEVACTVDETYMNFIRRVFGAHAHSGKQFVYFCEAQMVWDTAMAWHLLAYHQSHPERTVVVLAGSGHAWRRGIPDQIRRHSQAPFRIILPHIPGQPARETATVEDGDYLWLF